MKTKYLFIWMFFTLVCIGCKKTDSSLLAEKEIFQLKTDIINRGSQSSYTRLENYYSSTINYAEMLPYDLIMINKFNSNYSHNKILEVIIKLNNNGKFELSAIKKLNRGDTDFVIYYLLKGASKENPESIKTLSELYNQGWGVPKDLKKGDSLKSVYENMMWRR